MKAGIMKYKKIMLVICDILEMAAALLVLGGILLSTYSLLKNFDVFFELLDDMSLFKDYLAKIFILVIGIEFLQMLCRPNADNIIEVLLFLVARHMIVYDTTTLEDFVSVISIAILCVLRRYLHTVEKKAKNEVEECDDESVNIADNADIARKVDIVENMDMVENAGTVENADVIKKKA